MCDQRVLCIYLSTMILLHYVYVIMLCVFRVYRVRIGGSIELGPEGPSELWEWKVPLRHIDQRILQSHSLEWLIYLYVVFWGAH